jgi:hypothetical protein
MDRKIYWEFIFFGLVDPDRYEPFNEMGSKVHLRQGAFTRWVVCDV